MPIEAAESLLMFLLMPLWIGAGFVDWICHRRADIEHTAGVKETMIHFLMFMEMGIPLLATLFLEVNALIIVLLWSAFFVHELTAYWDVSFATTKRVITPFEQLVHSFLELVPFAAILLITVMHFEQFKSLLGLSGEAPRFELSWKRDAMSLAYVAGLLAAIFVCVLLPYANEFRRGLKARKSA